MCLYIPVLFFPLFLIVYAHVASAVLAGGFFVGFVWLVGWMVFNILSQTSNPLR